MRKELDDQNLESVAGGRYYINGNNNKIVFNSTNQVFTLKCSPYTAMEHMDKLINVYPSEAEYDAACIKLLSDNGWI